MFGKNRNWLCLILVAFLTLTLSACGGDFNPDINTEQPNQGGGSGGSGGGNGGSGGGNGGSGGGNGGSGGGSGGSGGNEPIDPTTGTWAKKDEDNDGVLDELDDFPFDPAKQTYPFFEDTEFNNNRNDANVIDTQYPFRISGKIQGDIDIDKYRFSVTSDDVVNNRSLTFVVFKDDANFFPELTIFDNDGVAIQTFEPRLAKVARVGTALSFSLRTAGTYYLSITDRNSNDSTSFSYIIEAILDADADGVDDIIEQALDMNPARLDTDGDLLSDGTEYHIFRTQTLRNHDVDNDNIPNWLDDDSDGDGIVDKLEGARNEDGDILPSFVDEDSDNNGVIDANDFDTNIGATQDTDTDGLYDYIDSDDDNDKLLDVNDPQPKVALNSYDEFQSDAPKLISLQYKKSNGEYLLNRVFKNQPVVITGKNFSQNSAILVIERDNVEKRVANVTININQQGIIESVFPNYPENNFGSANGSAFLVIDGKKTNSIDFSVLDEATPLLYSYTPTSAARGQKVSISGENFSSDTRVVFGATEIQVEYTNSQEISFNTPAESTSGHFYLKNNHGVSDSRFLAIGRSIDVGLKSPDFMKNLSGPFELENLTIDSLQDNQYELNIESQSATSISIYYPQKNTTLLKALVLPSNDTTEINLDTTVLAYSLLGITSGKSESELQQLIGKIKALPEYSDFYQYIETGLNADISFLSATNTALGVKIYELQQALSLLRKKSHLSKKNAKSQAQFNAVAADQRPTIFPEESQDDIKVEPTRGGITSLFEYDGYTELQNSTQMYLSAAVYPIIEGQVQTTPATGLDPADNKKSKTYSHITTMLDRDMIAPVDWVAFSIAFWSKDTDLDVCPYKDCLIEVISPGDEGEALTGDKAKVRRNLYIRNLIDRAVWPSIKMVAGLILDNIGDKKGDIGDDGFVKDYSKPEHAIHITDLLISTMPDVIDAIDDALLDGKFTADEQKDIFNEFKKILEKERDAIFNLSPTSGPGPLMKAIFAAAGIDLESALKALSKKIITEIAEGFIPFIGQVLKVIDVLKVISDTANLAETWYDLYNLKQFYHFKVTWGLKILEMSPAIVKAENKPVELEIKGTGLCPVEQLFGSDILPTINLKDKKTGLEKELTFNQASYIYTNDCASAKVMLPGSYLAQMQPDSEIVVEIDLDGEIANSEAQASKPPFLTTGSGLKISGITPSPAVVNTEVTIKGLGFSANRNENKVFFVNSSGVKIAADIVNASEYELVVLVPSDAVTGNVEVVVDSLTDTHHLEIAANTINIAFGDNGNLTDDSFDLSIDGKTIVTSNEGERRRDISRAVGAGKHQIKLIGNVVPDNRATYYICFSNNVDIMSGTASAAIDFPENTQFSETLTINVKPGVASSPVNCSFVNRATGKVIPLWSE